MEAEKERQEEVPVNIKEIFENDKYRLDDKIQAIQKLKNIFKPPDKVFSKMRLESLLHSARIALESKVPEINFLFNYGTALVGFTGVEAALDSELFHQLEYVLAELNKLDESKADIICTKLWSKLEAKSIFYYKGALITCKLSVERIVLNWMDTTEDSSLKFPARLAASSPQLFQTLTAILYEVLVRSHGLERVLKVTELFVNTVMCICSKEGKDFLGLYPKYCRRLVSLLMVIPEAFCKEGNITADHVNSLLSELFLTERNTAMILLSQYPSWVQPFKQYLKKTSVM